MLVIRTSILRKILGRIGKVGEEATGAIAKESKGANAIGKMTSKEATEAATRLGYSKINQYSHGQPIYMNPKGNPKYISPDADMHNGGVWKGANTISDLDQRTTRSGTYDSELNRIGD